MNHQLVDMTVQKWLEQHPDMPIMVNASDSIESVGKRMLKASKRDAYICESNSVKGHLSFIKVMGCLFAHEQPVSTYRSLFTRVTETSVAELMDPHFAYCHPEEKIADVLHRQLTSGTDDLLVLDQDNKIMGSVNVTTLLTASLL